MNKRILTLAGAIFLAGMANASTAGPIAGSGIVRYTFTGACDDCTGVGTGTLVLQNYQEGDDLTLDNFVEWTYSSNLLSVDITSVDYIDGSLADLPGRANVDFGNYVTNGDLSPFYFSSSTEDGSFNWDTGYLITYDHGADHTWSLAASSAAPEPGTWAMMVGGFGLAGATVRRKKPAVRFN